MYKHHLRLILLGFLFVTLFLPMGDDTPNWLFSLWYSLHLFAAIPDLIAEPNIGHLILWMGLLLGFLVIQILILFNLCLLFRKWERWYRISLLVLFPVTWWFVLFRIDPLYRSVGYWANPILVSIAALMEIGFITYERLKESTD